MDWFFKQLTVFSEQEPGMMKAADNIKKDCQSNKQPHGNIKNHVLDLICTVCHAHEKDHHSHIREVVRNHRSNDIPERYTPVSLPRAESLRRAVSLETFVQYHRLESFRGTNIHGKGFDSRSSVKLMKKQILTQLESGDVQIETSILQGSTGKPGEPTWWTFYEGDLDLPESGESYMKELALSRSEMNKAESDNTVLEIEIEPRALGKKLFKPTALDAFYPDTLFEPELTGEIYGFTAPPEPGIRQRPELVSESINYRSFEPNSVVNIKRIPYNIVQ